MSENANGAGTDNRRFLTIEGIEGAGKSSVIGLVAKLIRAREWQVVVTREPGGTPLGAELRQLMLHQSEHPIDPQAELLLMFADRAQHLNEQILPALERGAWVVCDRFTDSTFAYQGAGRGLPVADIEALQALVQRGLVPGLTLLLDVPVQTGQARARGRSRPDRIESAEDAFFERVREGFLAAARREPDRFRVIDAGKPLPDVERQIAAAVNAYLESVDD